MNLFVVILEVLLSVGFFMLLERKLLGVIQLRMGPLKMGFLGLIQFLFDALKLMFKETIELYMINSLFFTFIPLILLLMSIILWLIIPYYVMIMYMNLGLVFMMMIMSVKIFFLMLVSWSTNSQYGLMSVIRMISQMISYEMVFYIYLFIFLYIYCSFSLYMFLSFQIYVKNLFLGSVMFMIWILLIMVETSRLPFDFFEGESELISGFNIEYNSYLFMLLFICEYLDMIFINYITMIFYFGMINSLSFWINLNLLFLVYLWIRGFLIRLRFDILMMMMWKGIFPVMFCLMFLLFLMKFI